MYILTQEKDNLDSGAYATVDSDGTVVLQFFVDKDDAMTISPFFHPKTFLSPRK